MAELMARSVYQQAAKDLFKESPLPLEQHFYSAVVRHRIGEIIARSAQEPQAYWRDYAAG